MTNNNNQLTPQTTKLDKGYQSLLQELKSLLSKGLHTAYKAVDNIKVQTYWQLGERIVREELKHQNRADYGKYLIDSLAVDLGYGKQRLYEIVKFYRVYPIVRALHGQLSWYHYLELIKVNDDQKRSFYQNKTIINSWGYRELRKQIKGGLYENTSQKEIAKTSQTKLTTTESSEIFQDSYDFNFMELPAHKLKIRRGGDEKMLENKIVGNIKHFLKMLGEDFAFLGQQAPLKIDGETHFIDLVLYHRGIPCVILVELKTGKLNSRDVGQINKYIEYYRHNKQYDYEQDTIGLIICEDAGREEVRYALGGLKDRVFIATYKAKLPSEAEIKRAIRK